MLLGTYTGNLDDRRRVAVPKKFIEELGKKPIIAKWYEDCLLLVSSEFWQNILSRLTGGKMVLDLAARDIERFILASAFEVEPDKQGRIIIPEVLASYAHITKDIVFLGLGDRIEIWDKQVWDEKSGELAKITKSYVEELAKK